MREEFIDFEELYFAKVERVVGKYDLVHLSFNRSISKPIDSQHFVDLTYSNLCFYIKGASFGKNSEKLHVFNGIPPVLGETSSTSRKFSCLDGEKLEKFLLDTELKKEFGDKITTIK